ncbi:MAG: DUF4837 family protein [Candidatus Latescibacterota bacterium]|nr:MAG: DUF4837 family protein [Candidatus Latescibacterota bacterium]
MPRSTVTFVGIAVLLSVFSAGCLELDIPPAGSYSKIMLITEEGADDPFARELEPHLTKMLDFYIGEENQFLVEHARAVDMVEVPAVKNVLICGVANPVTDVGRNIVSQLGGGAVEQVKAGRANIFRRENLPGPGQLTVIVTAGSSSKLAELIDERGDEVAETIEESCRNRLRHYLLKHENKNLTKRLRETYGFTLRVPILYELLSEKSQPPGIELLREGPARLLGVFWLDWKDTPTLADSTALYDARASYVWERYDGDVMDSTRVAFTHDRLAEYPVIKMEGYWSNTNALAGGFYKTFFVFEERERLLWVIDILVFAPGLPKHPHFRELQALAETFRYE